MKLEITQRVKDYSKRAMDMAAVSFAEIDAICEYNTAKVLDAFQKNRVSDSLFAGSTGYGYGDRGREVLDSLYADIFGAEAALVRIGFANGTHAITSALFACLKPGDTLLSVCGAPYDTLRGVIGISGSYHGSLSFYGVNYMQLELLEDGTPDFEGISKLSADGSVRAVLIQRSRGYSKRPALSVERISEIISRVRSVNPEAKIIVDNCYGEFVERGEPVEAGADLIAGSLIKNPGGGLARTGGYVAGCAELVEKAAYRLTVPGIGGDCGATLGENALLFQGLFMAPHTVAQALKTAVFASALMELMGYEVSPGYSEPRYDIIQSIELGSEEKLKSFCLGIQGGAPVDSFVTPEAWDMPGYDCKVIMAAGAFIQGSSIELSADAPLMPPYRVFLQGGLTFESGKLGIMRAASLLE